MKSKIKRLPNKTTRHPVAQKKITKYFWYLGYPTSLVTIFFRFFPQLNIDSARKGYVYCVFIFSIFYLTVYLIHNLFNINLLTRIEITKRILPNKMEPKQGATSFEPGFSEGFKAFIGLKNKKIIGPTQL